MYAGAARGVSRVVLGDNVRIGAGGISRAAAVVVVRWYKEDTAA